MEQSLNSMKTIRRFKHKTGAIAEKLESFKYEIITPGLVHYPVPAWVIEGSADWEEIFEKYTIIEEESSSVPGSWLGIKEIIAVKRFSDGQIFRVGDMHTGAIFTKPREITKISISGEGLVFHQKGFDGSGGYTMLEDAKIFTKAGHTMLEDAKDFIKNIREEGHLIPDMSYRKHLYEQAIEYFKSGSSIYHEVRKGLCTYFIFKHNVDIKLLPELMDEKPYEVKDGDFWWPQWMITARINALINAVEKINKKLSLESDRINIYRRSILYINAITYYKETDFGRTGVWVGFCAYFKSHGYNINDLPELINQKPAIKGIIKDSAWWWDPHDIDSRIKALERALAEANHVLIH